MSSIFLSYASADRVAARSLRDALAKAGLEVWLDEEELAGGQAWDAKIRQQIRTCTYFMPIISATTETRREGYFRREWKLAVERTHDMADDVTFLVPVVIDDTPEMAARVPEKFTTVQWTRCPGGASTPDLEDLAHRLMTDHAAPLPPALPTASPFGGKREGVSGKREEIHASFPSFPHFPESGRWGRFIYDLVVWSGRMIYAMWKRLPRWLRVIAMVVIVFKVIGWFGEGGGGGSNDDNRKKSDSKLPVSLMADALQTGRPLALVNFTVTDPKLKAASDRMMVAMHRTLGSGGHDRQVAVSDLPFKGEGEPDQTTLITRAAILQCKWMLIGTVRPDGPERFSLEVTLYDTSTLTRIFTRKESGDVAAPEPTAESLARAVLEKISFDPPPAK